VIFSIIDGVMDESVYLVPVGKSKLIQKYNSLINRTIGCALKSYAFYYTRSKKAILESVYFFHQAQDI
jgi:hypothetical protein